MQHHFTTRIYYAETDAGGVVYHSKYLDLAERGRMEFLCRIGQSVNTVQTAHGLIFAVRHCDIEYVAPARLEDEIVVITQLTELGGASVQFRQVINKSVDGQLTVLAKLQISLVAINATGKPVRMPDGLRGALSEFLEPLAE